MTEKTRNALVELIAAVQLLTAATVRDTGVDTAGRIMAACEKAIDALNADPTVS